MKMAVLGRSRRNVSIDRLVSRGVRTFLPVADKLSLEIRPYKRGCVILSRPCVIRQIGGFPKAYNKTHASLSLSLSLSGGNNCTARAGGEPTLVRRKTSRGDKEKTRRFPVEGVPNLTRRGFEASASSAEPYFRTRRLPPTNPGWLVRSIGCNRHFFFDVFPHGGRITI